jgi:hypothetical protein
VLTTTTEVATPTEVAGTMVTSVAPTNTEVGEVRAENCSSIRSRDFLISYVGPANNCVMVLFIKVYQVCADSCFPILFIKVYYVGEIRVAPTNTDSLKIRVAPTNTEVEEIRVAPTNTEVEEIRVAPTNTEVVEETSTPEVVFVILHNKIFMYPLSFSDGFSEEYFEANKDKWLSMYPDGFSDDISEEYFEANNGMWLTGQDLFMHIQTIKDITTGTEFNITEENLRGWSVVVPDQTGVFPHPYFYLEKAFSSPHDRDLRMHFNQVTVHGRDIAQQPKPVHSCQLV